MSGKCKKILIFLFILGSISSFMVLKNLGSDYSNKLDFYLNTCGVAFLVLYGPGILFSLSLLFKNREIRRSVSVHTNSGVVHGSVGTGKYVKDAPFQVRKNFVGGVILSIAGSIMYFSWISGTINNLIK